MDLDAGKVATCECGCGRPVATSSENNRAYGWIKGQPKRFVHGHNRRRPFVERLMEKVDQSGGCWLWTGRLGNHGYGVIGDGAGSRTVLAHRAVYELLVGPVRPGLVLDHECETPACVNPAHLRPRTQGDHMRRHAEQRRSRKTTTELKEVA